MVPTRTDVPEYQKLTSQVHEIVGRINGRFGTLTAVAMRHLDRSLHLHALCALYAVTDETSDSLCLMFFLQATEMCENAVELCTFVPFIVINLLVENIVL
ncbi:alpha,alpha-trehalose-phosphate synthase [UDP-forming] 1-like [Malus domestica]|uniref:alpha,alpha-trehalose-phosphate synthase [UDP-forming] 1-like n=1 Tax=Malus domestica TaxID=3750 RepID=UPI0039764891